MKIAVLGLGFMGSTHLKAWRQIPGAQLAAVASNNKVRLSGDLTGVAGNLGGPGEKLDFSSVAKYSRAEDAVHDPDVEAERKAAQSAGGQQQPDGAAKSERGVERRHGDGRHKRRIGRESYRACRYESDDRRPVVQTSAHAAKHSNAADPHFRA